MSNFSKEKTYTVVIDAVKGPLVKRVDKKDIDSFAHDVVEGYFEALPVKQVSTFDNLILLVNDEGRLEGLQLNPWATLMFGKDMPMSTHFYIFGNAILFKKVGVELEPFTKEEALDLAMILRR